jgi:hypothetical protein
MYKFLGFSIACLLSLFIQAQAPSKPLSVAALNKQMSDQIADGKYEAAITTCNLLLAKNAKDSMTTIIRSSLKARLGKDAEAIADIKKRFLNKDSAANIISYLPILADFYRSDKSGELYYKAAIQYAPKLGIPYFLYGGELSEKGEHAKALEYAKIGYPLLTPLEKNNFIASYAQIYYAANLKKEAYELLDNDIKVSGDNVEVNRFYLSFLRDDQRYEEAISMADKLFAKDSLEDYLYARYKIYNKMGKSEMICRDASLLKLYFKGYDQLVLQNKCPEYKAEVFPTATTSYVYEVTTSQSTYPFIVSNAKVAMDHEISFKWKMGSPVNKEGAVTISKDAVNTANAQMNNFGSGSVNITDKTSVWISNTVYNQIKKDGKTFIKSSNEAGKNFTVVNDVEESKAQSLIDIDYDTNYRIGWLNIIHIQSEDGKEAYWINDDPKNPIIIKMALVPFSITLKEIKTK